MHYLQHVYLVICFNKIFIRCKIGYRADDGEGQTKTQDIPISLDILDPVISWEPHGDPDAATADLRLNGD